MKVVFHPDFPQDVRSFEADYSKISAGLGMRFRAEVGEAIEAVKRSPTGAGHIAAKNSKSRIELRRRNLRAFPFFVLYGVTEEQVVFGSLIPSRSDPLTWFTRFQT